MKLKNQRGITLIALIVTIIVLVIIAGISIAALTSDNGIIRQTSTAKIEQIEGTAREQVKLGVTALRLAIAEASAKDNSYRANKNVEKIQEVLLNIIQADTVVLEVEGWVKGTATPSESKFEIIYEGDDYKNACNYTGAKITYTITLGQKLIEITNEVNATLKDQNQNDIIIDVGGNTENGSGIKLVDVATIGDYVNYDPTSGGNVNATNTKYTSVAGSTTKHGNGYGDQTFSASAYKNSGGKWRIFNIEGKTITLISDPIYRDNTDSSAMLSAGDENGLFLQNGIGYLWAEEELHRIGAIYGHGEGADLSQTVTYYYGGPNDQDGSITAGTVEAQQGRKATLSLDTPSGARALTVEDVNKICDAKDSSGNKYGINYSGSTVTKTANNATYYPTLNGTSSTGQSSAVSSPSGSYYYTYYNYTISSANTDTTAQTNQKTMLKLETVHWLGSRCVAPSSSAAHFYVRCVYSDGDVTYDDPCFCYRRWLG